MVKLRKLMSWVLSSFEPLFYFLLRTLAEWTILKQSKTMLFLQIEESGISIELELVKYFDSFHV